MNLDEVDKNPAAWEPRRIMVFGPPKSGKTRLVGGLAAEGYNLHWFDCEGGIKTLLAHDSPARKNDGLARVRLYKLPDTQLYPIAYQTIDKVVKGGDKKICWDHGAVDCFLCKAEEKKGKTPKWNSINLTTMGPKDIWVIDSVSQLVASTLSNVVKAEIAKGNDDYKPDWDDWRKQGFLLDRIFGTIQAGAYNIIGISHEEQQKLENGSSRLVPVGGTGNFSKTFAKYWDDIVYTDVVNGSFRAYSAVEPGVNAIVGSRAGKKLLAGQGLVEMFK